MPLPYPRLVVAAAVLDSLEHPTAMLCTARSYPAEHAGQHELPGGKVDPGETPEEALVRELDEELSLAVRPGTELVPPEHLAVGAPAPDPLFPRDDAPAWPAMHGYRMRVWLAEPADPRRGPRRGSAHESVRWVALDEVEALDWLPADLPILARLRAQLPR
ncbi:MULTISPECIES: NUDIX domain-containing protein [unclassified Actinomyces]|uniref:(deoxy)nucleoside triphosphate pyrophosphohydrolase n=1 Tax=unclassified Actinomyces TaxID=2609248 RepID=UPI00201722F1|nr:MULTISPECIES: NUDIX domain-containing protein [unclassified Actinomyces]MCL3777791.1 NUDIX domain-containing protein [Actinomyces sp. AC-20-1]MCL3790695.1 NUDIX domain-containing protein [Actinomyces sp. 187325]MCL3792701.1 NUDIX domain-containing protein [Actinomyces sp. 186855]MCL3795424.1 NUDIX domain-containing protein [Actinomyces sp. 217892]